MQKKLEDMLASGQDNALLRFSLGELLYKDGAPAAAAEHLARAVEHDPNYSAAWKFYGRALLDSGNDAAMGVLTQGIEVARTQGDNQAAREMEVFLKRARKQFDAGRG